nr:hypothetical protein CFP56_66882 [Quercus suber]
MSSCTQQSIRTADFQVRYSRTKLFRTSGKPAGNFQSGTGRNTPAEMAARGLGGSLRFARHNTGAQSNGIALFSRFRSDTRH